MVAMSAAEPCGREGAKGKPGDKVVSSCRRVSYIAGPTQDASIRTPGHLWEIAGLPGTGVSDNDER